ncbi:MAG: hypothetical protein HY052_01220 [Proteobacteria bacterium]|nr:hypothetical protein [Pseudomonadota bacterium]
MKDQVFPPKNDLKAAFDRQKSSDHSKWEANGVTATIEALSKTFKALRDAGIDAHIQLSGDICEDAFSLVRTVTPNLMSHQCNLSGILKIDQLEYLLAISTVENTKPVLKIYVSEWNYKGQGTTQGIKGRYFDLNEDSEALQKLQKYIILMTVRNEIIRDHDVCDMFDDDGIKRLNKSPLAPKPQTAPKPDHP